MPTPVTTPVVSPEESPRLKGIARLGTRRRRVGRLSLTRKATAAPTQTVIMTANGPILTMLPVVPGKPPKRPTRRQMGGWKFFGDEPSLTAAPVAAPFKKPKHASVAAVLGKSEFNTLKSARNAAKAERNRLNAHVDSLTSEYAGRSPFSLPNGHPWKKALQNYAAANNAYVTADAAFEEFLTTHPSFRSTAANRRSTRRRGITRS